MVGKLRIFDEAFEDVKKSFPIRDYIGDSKRESLRAVVSELSRYTPFQGRTLLDMGCGPLDKTAVFAALGFSCTAVDDFSDPWHEERMETIFSYARHLGINLYRMQDEDDLPFSRGEFDVVTILNVIEHLHESPRSFLNSAGRLLKTGGLLVITMPNSVNLRKRLSVLRGQTNYPPVQQFYHSKGVWRGHVREYTEKEGIYILEESGFDVLQARTFEHLAQQKLRSRIVRIVYAAATALMPGGKSGLLLIARKPEGWCPVPHDPLKERAAMAASVPTGALSTTGDHSQASDH